MKYVRLLIYVAMAATLLASTAGAVPLELSYSGQLTDSHGNPITNLSTAAPQGTIGALIVTFWDSPWAGGAAPQTPPGNQRSVTLLTSAGGAPLTVPGAYLSSCSSGGSFSFSNCQSVSVNNSGVFQLSVYLSLSDFDTVFPDSTTSSYIQIENVYINTSTGTVTDNFYYPRQRFTVAPYCLKVPVDDSTLAYSGGNLGVAAGSISDAQISSSGITRIAAGAITDAQISSGGISRIAADAITDAQIASSGISTAGKVSGNAITSGTIAGSTDINTSGAVTAGAGSFTGLSVNGNTVDTGNGVPGYLAEFSGTNTLAVSPILDYQNGSVGTTGSFDVGAGVCVGTYAGTTVPPTDGIIVSGNVGIGTATPKNALDVSGSIAIGTFAGTAVSGNTLAVGGSAGIGTKTPGSPLTVASSNSAASGSTSTVAVTPSYNQSGSTANTDLLINRTGTTGTGIQRLIDAQVNGTSQFNVSSTGLVTSSGINTSTLALQSNNSNAVTLNAPTGLAGNYTLTLPPSTGTSGQLLTTNGAGILSWTTPSGGTLTGIIGSSNIAVSGSVTSPTVSLTSTVPVSNGGTGLSIGSSGGIPYYSSNNTMASSASFAQNGVLIGGGPSGAPTSTAAGSQYQTLVANASGTPTFQSLNLASPNAVGTSILGVTNGGTGASTASAALASLGAVSKAGDTMTGTLNLPANGLVVGTNQLVASGGYVGIGTATPGAKLQIGGTPGADGLMFPDGTLQTTATTGQSCAAGYFVQGFDGSGHVVCTSVNLGPAGFSSVSTGGYSTFCSIMSDQTLACWGYNGSGELGNGDTTASDVPVFARFQNGSLVSSVTSTAGGNSYNCASRADGTVWCWGYNANGNLGNGTTNNSFYPVQVSGITNAVAVYGGWINECALLANGTVQCWGYNGYGQLGNGTTTTSPTPVTVTGLSNVTEVSVGDFTACAAGTYNGTTGLWCWGYNGYGQLGNGTTSNSSVPVRVSNITNSGQTITSLTVGGSFNTDGALYTSVCAARSDGTVWCWGYNGAGALGNGTQTTSYLPVQVVLAGGTPFTGVKSLAGGSFGNCAVKTDNSAWCWGYNNQGQFCTSASSVYVNPIAVPGLGGSGTMSNVASIGFSTNGQNAAVVYVHNDGTASACGEGANGEMGDDYWENSSVAVGVMRP